MTIGIRKAKLKNYGSIFFVRYQDVPTWLPLVLAARRVPLRLLSEKNCCFDHDCRECCLCYCSPFDISDKDIIDFLETRWEELSGRLENIRSRLSASISPEAEIDWGTVTVKLAASQSSANYSAYVPRAQARFLRGYILANGSRLFLTE